MIALLLLALASSASADVGHKCVEGCDGGEAPSSYPQTQQQAPQQPRVDPAAGMMRDAIIQGFTQGIQKWKQDSEQEEAERKERLRRAAESENQERERKDQEKQQQLEGEMMLGSPVRTESPACAIKHRKIADLEDKGLRDIDKEIARANRMIEDGEKDRGTAAHHKKDAVIDAAADVASDRLGDAMQDFTKKYQTIHELAAEVDIARGRVVQYQSVEEAKRLHAWLEGGYKYGGGVLDGYQAWKESGTPANKKKIMSALQTFKDKFVNDSKMWEFIGDKLALAGGGKAGQYAFKAAVFGVNASAAWYEGKVAEGDINEGKYLLGNMLKIRAEMKHKIDVMKKQALTECGSAD